MNEQDFMYSSPEDKALYASMLAGFPHLGGFSGTGKDKYGQPIPFGCGPHSFRAIRRVSELVKPKKMLEIGFNMGYGAMMWLHSSDTELVSLDISDKEETLAAAKLVDERNPNRFKFVLSDSREAYEKLKDHQFDLIFIDGDHTLPYVISDIELALRLGIKNICFDDWLPQFGPGVQSAIKKFPSIKIVEVVGNIALGKTV